jgi:hypothetical protein
VRLFIIFAVVLACAFGTIFLLRRSAPPATTLQSSSPLDPSIQIKPRQSADVKSSVAVRIEGSSAADLIRAFEDLDEEQGYRKVTEIVDDWGAINPAAVFSALLRAPEGATRQNALVQLAAIWAESDPRAAADAFKAQTSDEERDRGVAQVIATWAKIEPMAALEWVNQSDAGADSRSPLREQLYSSWASVEPETAARYALAHGGSAQELDAVFGSWANSDLAAALQFQKNELSPEAQIRARPVLLLSAAGQNSPFAETILNEFLSSNPTRDEALRIGKSLSSLQPRLAHMIANQLPAGPDTEALRNRIAALNPALPRE